MSAHDPPGAVKKAKASARVESSKKAHRYFTTVRAGCPPPALSTIRMNSLSAFVTLGELAVVQRLVLESLVKPGPVYFVGPWRLERRGASCRGVGFGGVIIYHITLLVLRAQTIADWRL